MAIRLLIVDDQIVVRQGLKMFLQLDPDIELIGEAENGQQAVQLAFDLQPNLILMDLLMPIMNGIMAARIIREQLPQTAIIAITSTQDDDLTYEAVRAGVDCLIQKTLSPEKLIDMIKSVTRGQVVLPLALLNNVLAHLDVNLPSASLAHDEVLLLQLLAKSISAEDIQKQLKLDDFNYRLLLQQVQTKFKVSSTLLLVLSAMKLGFIS